MRMKRFVSKFVVLSVLACFAVGAAFAQQATFDQAKLIKPVTKTLKFVFIPKLVHPWYKDVELGAQFAINELKKEGIKVEMKWDAPATADIQEQIKKIEANISSRPDGLAIACLDPATDTQVINDAIKAGIKVTTFDTDAPDSNRILYVGHNGDYDDGYKSGEIIAKKIGGKGEVGVMVGSLAAPNHVNRVKGFKDAIAKFKDISIVFEQADNDDIQKAMDMTEAALQAHPNIKGIYCNNASNGIGAPRAIKNAGLAGKVVLVVDSLMPEEIQLLKEGVITMGNAQRQWDIGYWTVKYLVALNENHTTPKVHETGAMLFTKDDLVKAGIIK
jgi:ribose transport system substrate-binding protein